MEKLLEILQGIRPDINFEDETQLIDAKVLDSFDIIAIVSEISEEFDVDIDVADLEPENFNTVEAMWDLVQKLQ